MRYSLDTSSLIEGYRRIFPYDILPTFWRRDFPKLVESGDVRATEVVQWELQEEDDEVLQFVDDYEELFVKIDEPIQHEVRAILAEHGRLIRAGRSGADPFVIALAKMDVATVVCEERRKPTAPKIPDVCDALGIRCIPLLALVRENGFEY
jgi:Domain of unknown function (DUF4411)